MSYCRHGSNGGKSDVYCIQHIWGEYITYLKYDKPYKGIRTFYDSDLDGFLETLNCLKEANYNVPYSAIERVENEIENE